MQTLSSVKTVSKETISRALSSNRQTHKWEPCGTRSRTGGGQSIGIRGNSSKHSSLAWPLPFLTQGLTLSLREVCQMSVQTPDFQQWLRTSPVFVKKRSTGPNSFKGWELRFKIIAASFPQSQSSCPPTHSSPCQESCSASLPCTVSSEDCGKETVVEPRSQDGCKLFSTLLLSSCRCLLARDSYLY